MDLGNWLAGNILSESNIKNIIVIYPGRFQPMGRHHAAVYKKLASKFGKSNTYIATSDKVQLPKSPLNFKEKQLVMKQHGITNVVQVKNPYQSIEITSKYDPETTAVLFAVGKKDMQEDPRFRVGTKKNGDPSYFQYYDQNQGNLQSYTKHGYLIVAPHVDIQIPGFGEMSGTTLRQVLASADEKTFEDVMGFFDPRIHGMLRQKFAAAMQEHINEFISKVDLKDILSEASLIGGSKADVDDGPRYFYGNRKSYENGSKAVAERLGYQVVHYLLDPNKELTNNNTEFPLGPPDAVSFFPVGQAGATNAGTNYTKNLRGTQAYKVWSEYIKKVAERVGYTFLNFLGAETSIASSAKTISTPEPLVQESFSTTWWKTLLSEGRYDKYVLDLSHQLITNFKKNKNYKTYFEINRDNGEYAQVDLDVKFKEDPNLPYAYEVEGGADFDEMDLTITWNPKMFPMAFNDLIAEVKETLRHEIEHIGQDNFEGKYIADKKEGPGYKDYLLQTNEVPAYVQGLYKRAKTKKITIDNAFDEWYNENKANFDSSKDWEDVKKVWLNYAKKHLPAAKYSTNESLLSEAKANTHLTHLEELILTQGEAGYKQARSFLIELIKNLKGSSDTKVDTTVKWDGAPAIFTGINPDNGRFFVGTKSVFNKVPKINYTNEDIERNHGDAPGLAIKLKKALEVLPALGIKNILQGDFMFDDSTLKRQTINGIPHYTFKPNTITYAAEVDSDLGRRLEQAEFGIVFHTVYNNGLGGGATFGAHVDGLNKTPNVWFDDAFFKDSTGSVLLTTEEAKKVTQAIKQADAINVDYDKIPSELLNRYINSEIRVNQFLNDPKKSFEAFKAWHQSTIDKKIDKLKSERGKQKAIEAGRQWMANIDSIKKEILDVFTITKLLAEAKMIFVNKYNNAVYATKHFKDDGQGGLIATAPEGFVAIDHFGNGVKLVDRLEFSRANFAMDKGFTK